MLVTPLVLIQIFSKRMLVDWSKCRSDPELKMRVTLHVCIYRDEISISIKDECVTDLAESCMEVASKWPI